MMSRRLGASGSRRTACRSPRTLYVTSTQHVGRPVHCTLRPPSISVAPYTVRYVHPAEQNSKQLFHFTQNSPVSAKSHDTFNHSCVATCLQRTRMHQQQTAATYNSHTHRFLQTDRQESGADEKMVSGVHIRWWYSQLQGTNVLFHAVFMVHLLLGFAWTSRLGRQVCYNTLTYQERARDPTWSYYDTVISRGDVPRSEEKLIILYPVIPAACVRQTALWSRQHNKG